MPSVSGSNRSWIVELSTSTRRTLVRAVAPKMSTFSAVDKRRHVPWVSSLSIGFGWFPVPGPFRVENWVSPRFRPPELRSVGSRNRLPQNINPDGLHFVWVRRVDHRVSPRFQADPTRFGHTSTLRNSAGPFHLKSAASEAQPGTSASFTRATSGLPHVLESRRAESRSFHRVRKLLELSRFPISAGPYPLRSTASTQRVPSTEIDRLRTKI